MQMRRHGRITDATCGQCGDVLASGRRKWCSERCAYRAQRPDYHPDNDRTCMYCGASLAGRFQTAVICRGDECMDKWRKDYRIRTKEHRAARDKQYHAKNREQRVAYLAEWRTANSDKIREQRRTDEAKAYSRLHCQARRARILQNGCYAITRHDVRRLLARYEHRCAYCRCDGHLELDHVVPLARGGQHSIGNLVPACVRCNRQKNKQLVVEWRRVGGGRWDDLRVV